MSISNEKAYEHAREIHATVRDLQLEEIVSEITTLVRKHRRTASNEVVAVIAWEAFCDSCESWDIPLDESTFDLHFPELVGF